ncbi:MAG: GAF domain-containing protein [Chloroflexi bacterium]|nr:GAF domain-containing protein [Chloroflexota bacterium]
MTDRTNMNAAHFLESLHQLMSSTERLESVLARMMQALEKNGIKLSVDVAGIMATVRQDTDNVERASHSVFTELGEFQQLVRTSALITSSLDLQQVLQEVMDTIISLTRAERAYLMLRDHETDELSIRAARNWDRESLAQEDAIFSRSIVNSAIAQGEPIITTNAQSDDRFQGMQSVVSNSLRSILCIPLVLHGRIVGVLYADNRIEQGLFNQDSVPLMLAFGSQAAIAIDNARLFAQVKADLDKAQREVQRLQIQIDQKKVTKEVKEITETDYFQTLSSLAKDMRRQFDDDPNNK